MFRKPAVSKQFNLKPLTSKEKSIKSRVVPGTFVTMDRSFPKRALVKVDLPTFTGPAKTTLRPFF